MKLIKTFTVSMIASLFTLVAIAQEANDTDSTAAESESLSALDSAEEDAINIELPELSLETIDGFVESTVQATMGVAGLTFQITDSLVDDAISELETTWSSRVEKFDTDKNGSLSFTELESVPDEEWSDEYKALSEEERDEALRDQFKELDSNENGEITTEEVVELLQKQMDAFNELIKSFELPPPSESEIDDSDSVE